LEKNKDFDLMIVSLSRNAHSLERCSGVLV